FLVFFHPDIEFRSLIAESEGQTYRGHDGARAWWSEVVQSIGGIRFEREHIEPTPDGGITRLRLVGTIEGVEVPQMLWQAWRVRDGLVCWWAGYRTEAEAREAMGLRP
ncbi:MAG TPA: nuclear transport factor 2 family protein, partial [Thermoleophilaceae bacterium]